MFENLQVFENRYEELNAKLYDPASAADRELFAALMKEHKELEPIVEAYRAWRQCRQDLAGARELLEDTHDRDLRELAQEEVKEGEGKLQELEERLKVLLLSFRASHCICFLPVFPFCVPLHMLSARFSFLRATAYTFCPFFLSACLCIYFLPVFPFLRTTAHASRRRFFTRPPRFSASALLFSWPSMPAGSGSGPCAEARPLPVPFPEDSTLRHSEAAPPHAAPETALS